MRKRIVAALALAALLATAALAAAGTAEDPFVTLSYLTDTYYKQIEEDMLERARRATAAVERDALDKLEALTEDFLIQDSGLSRAEGFLSLSLARGDKLELTTGSGLLYGSGQAELSLSGGTLVDVTDGSTLSDGGLLTPGRRYIVAEGTACALTVRSDAAYLSVQGYYGLERSGVTCTPFTDLTEADWYYAAVRFAYDNSLFKGDTPTTFSANTNMNRAMLATVLSRFANMEGAAVPSAGFTDVADSDWYAAAVNWAAAAGIVSAGGAFRPLSDVTREEFAVMLYRYAGSYMGLDVTTGEDLSAFADRDKVSSWAEAALAWAVERGILTGYTDSVDGAAVRTLKPGGTATRAEVATMLQRFSALLP